MSVCDVKNLLQNECNIEPDQMKLIFKGKILKDHELLGDLQVVSGSNMHVVKSAPNASSPSTAVAVGTEGAAAAHAVVPSTNGNMHDNGGLNSLGGMGGAPGIGLGGMDPAMMQQMMALMGGTGSGSNGVPGGGMGGMGGMDPAMMGQMLQNPMVQQMVQQMAANPAMMQQAIQSNPMLQEMAEQNPMMQQMLSNPQMLQSMMNPQMMQMAAQMHAGGVGAAPSGATQAIEAPAGAPAPAAGTGFGSVSGGINSAPTGGMAGMDPAMMQQMMAMQGVSGNGGHGFPSGGMGGMDPAMMGQMLQNPMMQQMVQQMASNPAMMQQMIQGNPMLQQMAQQNPMMQQMLSNPQMLQTMLNPRMMQMVAQMHGSGMGATPTGTMGAIGAPEGAVSPAVGAPAAGNPMMDPAMMAMMQQMMAGGGMAGVGGPPSVDRPADARYSPQAEQLKNMGFPDERCNMQALAQSNGDINMAITILVGA